MDHRLLETFAAVVESGSFSQASKRLYLSTAGVIKHVDLLESQIGVPLFHRSNRGITLTAAGRSFYQDAREILAMTREAVRKAQGSGAREDRLFRVVIPTDAPAKGVQGIWPYIQEQIPQYRFEFITYGLGLEHSREIYADLGEKVDALCSVYDPARVERRGMEARKLWDASICCMVPLLHPLCRKERLEPEDLFGETVLLVKKGEYPLFDAVREVLAPYPFIRLEDVPALRTEVYNRCVNEEKILIDFDSSVPPMVKAIPFRDDKAPFGLYYYPPVREKFAEFFARLDQLDFSRLGI